MSKIYTICGNPEVFAIECEVFTPIDQAWIFGHFRFWLYNIGLGDWDDQTSLFGCFNWLQEFVETSRNRYESGLLSLSKNEVFNLLLDHVEWKEGEYKPYPNTYTRFHIEHLGMSAFNQYDILLVEDQEKQRVLWRKGNDPTIHDAYLPAGEMQKVTTIFLHWFKRHTNVGE